MYQLNSNSSEPGVYDAFNKKILVQITTNRGLAQSKALTSRLALSPESKDLLLKFDFLKKEMQKNVIQASNLTKVMSSLSLINTRSDIKEGLSINSTISQIHNKQIFTKAKKRKLSIDFRRKISDIINPDHLFAQDQEQDLDKISAIRKNVIGFNTRYMSPFNIQLQSVYVDHTATNRPYKTVENMVEYAKRFTANAHTQCSHFGKFSTEMMDYALDSLLRSFSADDKKYVALPSGSGCTGATEKALQIIKALENDKKKPSIYITSYEHHSNILPWVQFYDSLFILASDQQGNIVIDKIEQQLLNSPTQNIIVSVSAASNVTSTLTDLQRLNNVIKLVRKKKDIIFAVDCAAYCCHHELNLKKLDEIDFIYLSPHKNLGGAEACGVLVVKKSIAENAKTTFPGGSTVAFVRGYAKTDVMYDVDIFSREVIGNPPFLGFYRAALSFQLLKNDIGYDFIHKRQQKNTRKFMEIISAANVRMVQRGQGNKIVIYGDKDFSKRANVITFNIISRGHIMQHNLVSLILADVFGVQLRSGCFCAGPFGMQLLKLDEATVGAIKDEVSVGILKDKPGFLRLDLTFYLEIFEIQFLANAIIGVAEYSKSLGRVYTLCNDGEIIRHKLFKNFINDKYSLCNADFTRKYVQNDQLKNAQRLKKRKETLQKQYKRGMNIVMEPIQFLRYQINSETF